MDYKLGSTHFSHDDIETVSVRSTIDGAISKFVVMVLFMPALFFFAGGVVFYLFNRTFPDFVYGFLGFEFSGLLSRSNWFFITFLILASLAVLWNYIKRNSFYVAVRLKSGRMVRSNSCSKSIAEAAADSVSQGTEVRNLGEGDLLKGISKREVLGISLGPYELGNTLIKIFFLWIAFDVVSRWEEFFGGFDFSSYDSFLESASRSVGVMFFLFLFVAYLFSGGIYWCRVTVWKDGRLYEISEFKGKWKNTESRYNTLSRLWEKGKSEQSGAL